MLFVSKMVPVSGLEPEEKQGLSLSRLPFRQTGIWQFSDSDATTANRISCLSFDTPRPE